jgi:uncharacterized phage infection (PIP) family protein YhgE
MWPLFRATLDSLSTHLESSLNQLSLGHDVIVEDSDLLLEQISEIATQLSQANQTLTQNESHVSNHHLTCIFIDQANR